MEGNVYILVNSSFPNLIKIGRTAKSPHVRAQELSGTGTPGKFVVAYSVLVNDCIDVESDMHSFFLAQRHTNDREFFGVEAAIAIDKLIEIAKDRRINELNGSQAGMQNQIATFYLLKVNELKKIYRIGLVNKAYIFLIDEDFKRMVVELYQTYDKNDFYDFYDCEIVDFNEFEGIDVEGLECMRELIDKNLMRLSWNNPSIFDVNKYDASTMIEAKGTFPKQVYQSILSLLEPIAKASILRGANLIKFNEMAESRKLIEDRLRKIDSVKAG